MSDTLGPGTDQQERDELDRRIINALELVTAQLREIDEKLRDVRHMAMRAEERLYDIKSFCWFVFVVMLFSVIRIQDSPTWQELKDLLKSLFG